MQLAVFLQAAQGFLKPFQVGLNHVLDAKPLPFAIRGKASADVAERITRFQKGGGKPRERLCQVVPKLL